VIVTGNYEAVAGEPHATLRVKRKAFALGDYAVSIVPKDGGFAFALHHPTNGDVGSGEGFTCLGLAESAARARVSGLIAEELIAR